MKRLNFVLLSVFMTTFAFGQVETGWRLKLKSNPDNPNFTPHEVTDEALELSYALHANYESVKEYEFIEISASRGEKKNGGTYRLDPSVFNNPGLTESDKIAGGRVGFVRVFDFQKDPEKGFSMFSGSSGQFFLSKKGHDYSNFEEEDSYTLIIRVFGVKITGYEKEWIDGRWVEKPIYSYTELAPPAKIKVITSDRVAPHPKTKGVGDVEELNKLFGTPKKEGE